MTKVLDQGYVELIEKWGSDESIIEAARESTDKGFLGWGPKGWKCDTKTRVPMSTCDWLDRFPESEVRTPWEAAAVQEREARPDQCPRCGGPVVPIEGDEKLLRHLWDNQHSSPFEFAGMIVRVQAPIMVFREWHRHRTQSFSEVSARYVPLPNENYIPPVERMMINSATNKQAGVVAGADTLTTEAAIAWRAEAQEAYDHAQRVYEHGLKIGVPKELARLPVPVARFSRMRASALLLNWFKFLKLRCAPTAQYEIRVCANEVAKLVKQHFPRTYEVAHQSLGLPA